MLRNLQIFGLCEEEFFTILLSVVEGLEVFVVGAVVEEVGRLVDVVVELFQNEGEVVLEAE